MELMTNPFFTLGATMRDNRRRIMDLAEEKSLVSDETAVREASSVLLNPRRRLEAEIGWLPGLSPKRISEAISVLDKEPIQILELGKLPSLARANLLADGLVRVVESLPQSEVASWILELADSHDGVESEATITELNEERSVAGFPSISDRQTMEAELQRRRQYYRQTITNSLNKLPTLQLVEIISVVVDQATNNGGSHAPILIDDLVDSFEVEAQDFLETETENIDSLIERIRQTVVHDKSEEHLDNLVSQLANVVKNWVQVARPIQVSARSRGTNHAQSLMVSGKVRSLAVDLFNEHGLIDLSKQLTALQQDVFSEVDEVVEQSKEDSSALEALSEDLTYEADVGRIFKSKLRISPRDGVQWQGTQIPLEDIKRVRWGGTRHSINGVPTGTTYHIFIANENARINIELRKEQIYSEFIDRLWKTAGMRLLNELLVGLRTGKRYRFGAAIVTDYGIEMVRRKIFSANEAVLCKWTDLVIGNRAGKFYIAKEDERKVSVELPYQEVDNVHILEAGMRVLWKNLTPRISDLLENST